MPTIPEFTARLLHAKFVANETKVFRFEILKTPEFTFLPGQFVSLKIAEKVFRAYSLASACAELPSFEICAKLIPGGVGSMYLENLQNGDEITFRGAFGRFLIKNPASDKIFFATGSGIAPIKCFVAEFAAGNLSGQHTLVFGLRNESYAPYLPEFHELQAKNPNFKFVLCLSRPEPNDQSEFSGRITDWATQEAAEFFTQKDIYLCGSPEMVKDLKRILLTEKNVSAENIFTEAY